MVPTPSTALKEGSKIEDDGLHVIKNISQRRIFGAQCHWNKGACLWRIYLKFVRYRYFLFCDVHEKVFEDGTGERQRNAARN